jgi:hypothetical protein
MLGAGLTAEIDRLLNSVGSASEVALAEGGTKLVSILVSQATQHPSPGPRLGGVPGEVLR